ncbi:MAG: ankyrin repeat domain-containing protein [Myxococcota bacterium]
MSWWDKLKALLADEKPNGGKSSEIMKQRAKWLDASETSFGVPVLDLISVTGGMISTSQDMSAAAMAISWSSKTVADLPRDVEPAESIACDLRYPIEPELPDGFLYTPAEMEQKYVIGYREHRILLARSWTGNVQATAETRRTGDQLIIERLHLMDDTLKVFGDPVQTFDWILRSHALDQVLPLPVSDEAAKMLEAMPLSVFSHFGNIARCAATSWNPTPPARPLRSFSAVLTAVRCEQPEEVARLVAAGHSVNTRAPAGGYTPLHIAAGKGNLALTRQLLDLGADPNLLAERDASALVTALVHKAPLAVLELLIARGADPKLVNIDGFGALHALAEIDHTEPLRLFLSQGLHLEQRTHRGYTPLHIAAALGHIAALNALLQAGADPDAHSNDGQTARDIAISQSKNESVAALDAWQKRAP